jgi:hypothetical protein
VVLQPHVWVAHDGVRGALRDTGITRTDTVVYLGTVPLAETSKGYPSLTGVPQKRRLRKG